MGYCEDQRKMIGNAPLIFVRPSVAIFNEKNEILLTSHDNGLWTIPGGTLQLNESVEECLERIVLEDIGIKIRDFKLFKVYSRRELINKVGDDGDEYHPVAIVYLCKAYNGDITPNKEQGVEAQFFKLNQLPEPILPIIRSKLVQLAGSLNDFIR